MVKPFVCEFERCHLIGMIRTVKRWHSSRGYRAPLRLPVSAAPPGCHTSGFLIRDDFRIAALPRHDVPVQADDEDVFLVLHLRQVEGTDHHLVDRRWQQAELRILQTVDESLVDIVGFIQPRSSTKFSS